MIKYMCIKELIVPYYTYNIGEIVEESNNMYRWGYNDLCVQYNPLFIENYFIEYNEWLSKERDRKIDEILYEKE